MHIATYSSCSSAAQKLGMCYTILIFRAVLECCLGMFLAISDLCIAIESRWVGKLIFLNQINACRYRQRWGNPKFPFDPLLAKSSCGTIGTSVREAFGYCIGIGQEDITWGYEMICCGCGMVSANLWDMAVVEQWLLVKLPQNLVNLSILFCFHFDKCLFSLFPRSRLTTSCSLDAVEPGAACFLVFLTIFQLLPHSSK